MKYIILIAALVCSVENTDDGNSVYYYHTGEILKFSESKNHENKGFASGYIMGVSDMLAGYKNICVPVAAGNRLIQETALSFMRKDYPGLPAMDVVVAALRKTFPCKKE